MKKIGIEIDFSYICTDYNTSYLDRDNLDPATSKCMKQLLTWSRDFLSDFVEKFDYNLYHLHSDTSVKINEIASKRFLFYSLEKEITLQSYVLQKKYVSYNSLSEWESENNEGMLIQNDENGSLISFYFNENSEVHQWVRERIKNFSLEEIPFRIK